MIKKCITIAAMYCCVQVSAQIDSTAIMVLDRMSDVIGDLSSCSFTLETASDKAEPNGSEKKFYTYNTYMNGPDELYVEAVGEQQHKGYWYNGSHLVYYSFNENNYSVVDAPDNTLDMIEEVNQKYELDFPAADFFYPTFTDDLIEHFSKISYLGKTEINGKECFHILADNTDLNVQIWVSNDAFSLPEKFNITYKKKPYSPQYLATFSNWKINPELPELIFDFIPPSDAKEIAMIPAK